MACFHGDGAFIQVLVWAFIGIGSEQGDTPPVANAAFLAAGAAALLVIIVIIQRLRKPRPAG
jgi:uncharacterized membrane protein